MSDFFENDGRILIGKMKITERQATTVPNKEDVFVYGASFNLKTSDKRLINKVAKIDILFENDLNMIKAPALLDDIFFKEAYREFYSNDYYFDNLEYYYVEDRDE